MADKEGIRDLADDELEFYTDLVLQESQRWIEVVTRKKFVWLDFCESLRNGVHLCQLLTCIWPGSVENINYDPKGGTENLDAFIKTCQELGIEKSQIFDPRDLLDNFLIQGDLLDRETQRRLISITVTIYHIGKLARASEGYFGPQLDFSAFSAIVPYYVKHKDDLFKAPLRRPVDIYQSHSKDTPNFCEQNSEDISHYNHENHPLPNSRFYDKAPTEDFYVKNTYENCRIIKGQQHSEDHFRDSSYGSLGSCDRGQFDEDGPVDMPGKFDPPFSVYSSSNAATGQDSYLSYDASYGSGEESNFRDSKWKQNSVDLSDAYSDRLHDRYSSTDSMDATGRSSHQHSRQVSTDSMESIPTRMTKRSSFTPVHDPLQFVKVEPSPIAKQVEQTVKTYEEVVKVKEILKEDEEQWQSNLDNWKSRRRRISSKTLQSKDEEMGSIQKLGGELVRRKSKTFKEIMEEREKRKQEIPYLGLAQANVNPFQRSKASDDDDVFEKNAGKAEDSRGEKDARELDSQTLEESKLSDRSRQLNGDLSDKDSTNPETLDVHTSDSEQHSSKGLQDQYPDMTDEEDSNEEKSWSRIESEKNQRNESNLAQRHSAYWSSSRSYDSAEHEHNDLDCTKRVKSVPNLQSKEASDQKSDGVSRKSSSMCKSKSFGDIRHDERYHPLEKIITITQRPRSGQTFGFTIKGGKEHKSPIFVDNVIPASSAALCDVKRGDEILSLNGVDMKNNFHTSAMFVIQQAIKTGCIEIKIRRDSVRNLGQSSGARALLAKKNKKDDKSFDEKKKLFESQTNKPNLSDSVSSSLKRDTPSSAISRKKFMFENGSTGDQSPAGHNKLEHRRSLDVKKHYQEMLASLEKPVQKTVATREPGSMLDFVTDADREYSSVKPRTSQLKEDFDSLFLKTASLDRHPFNMQKYYAKYATENKTSLDVETIQQKQSLEPLNTSRKDVASHQKPIDVVYSSDNEASEEEKQYHSLSARRFDYQSDPKKHQDNEEKLPDVVENWPEKPECLEVEVQRPKEDLHMQTQHEETGELESPTVIFKPAEEEELVIYEDDIRPSLAPPTEKPPPPPKLSSSESSRSPSVSEEPIWPCNDTRTNAEKQLLDDASPDQAQGSFLAAKLRRINSTKRIRSEILRRRSDYLMSKDSDSDSNIDNDELWFSSTNKEIFVDDIDDLESNSNPSLSIDISNRDADDEEEIARKEREIIENLEMEEKQHLKSYNSHDEIDREQLMKYHDEKEKQRHQVFSFETQALMEQYEEQKKKIQEEESQWKDKQTRRLEEFEREQKRYLEKEAFNAERARRIEEFERDSRNKAEEYKCRQDDLWDRYEFEHQRLQQLHNHEWRKHMEEKARDMNLMQIENYHEHREISVDDPAWKKEDDNEPEWNYHHGTKVEEQEERMMYHHPNETYEPKHPERKLFEIPRESWNSKEDDTYDESRLQEKKMYAELEEQQKELEHQKLLRERREEEKRIAEEEQRLQDIEQERLEALEEERCRKDEERRLQELRSREELELLKEKEEKLRLQEDLEANSSSVLECRNNTSAPGRLQVRVVRGAHEPYFFVQRIDQERLRREEERLREESEKLRLEKEEHQRNVQAEKLRAEKEKERAYAYSFAYEPLPGERYDKNFGNYPSVGDHNQRTEWSQPFEEQKKPGSSSHTGVELHKTKCPPRYRPPPLTLTKSTSAPSQVPNPPMRLPPRVPPKPLSPKPPATPEEMERLELLRLSKQPTPSDDYKKPELEDTDDFSVQVEPLSKKSMYSLSAVPKAKILGTEQWIEQYERNRKDDGRPRRKPDAPRKGLANVQDHWVVQEAERRRLAEKENRERLQKLQNRNSTHLPTGTLPDEFAIAPQRQKLNRHSAHIMEKIDTQAPSEPKPYQPIPDSIIQSLTQRLNSNKYSNPVYNPPPQYSQNRVPPPNVIPSHKSAIPPPPPPPPPDQRSSIGSAESQQELLSVSGKKKCSECGEELGRGAAMIIESLNLFYHLQCFKCCVCDTQLGNGSRGADVRVRHNKLHCHNCYSNDEAGLKLSKV